MIFLQRLFVVLVVIFLCSKSSMSRGVQLDYNIYTHSASRGNHNKIAGTSTLGKLVTHVNNLINSEAKTKQIIINVDAFGAKADGRDDSKAFLAAWTKACKIQNSVLLVPKNKTYLLKPPIDFVGPCQKNFIMNILGTIEASRKMSDYKSDPRKWVVFDHVNDFTVDGGGTFNGNGKVWWETSCKVSRSKDCRSSGAPTAVTFNNCKNLKVKRLRFLDAQQMHLSFDNCQNVIASNLTVRAPKESPNTDGIHVTSTQNIQIQNCTVGTGDDCISIVSGSKNVQASNIECGPGHGISIGSLGKDHANAIVSNVYVKNATLHNTTNGVRIKTWQGGLGYATNIKFEDVVMMNVTNPIIINQNYCDKKGHCQEQKDAVKVENVLYKNIRGTSASEVAMDFNCSKSIPCENIKLNNIHLIGQGVKDVNTFFVNANLTTVGDILPPI